MPLKLLLHPQLYLIFSIPGSVLKAGKLLIDAQITNDFLIAHWGTSASILYTKMDLSRDKRNPHATSTQRVV